MASWGSGFGRLAAAVTGGLALLAAGSAAGLPSTKIGTATLQSPSAADAYYGSGTTHTNSTGAGARPAEVQELARALKNDPDLIYEYVRNNTEIVWTYGLSKGAMGVIVDRAGTSFDQAHLMVELLRQAGYTVSYQLGTITLSGSQFQAWSGITSAQAACQLLSAGGIPAAINGTTPSDCTTYGAATITTIDVAHAWVSVVINGVSYLYDPAYKDHTFVSGINLATATGMTAGSLAGTSATSGSTSGVTSVASLDNTTTSGITYNLGTWAANLDAAVAALTGPGVADVVGGQSINAQAIPSGGLRQVSLPYTAAVQHTISGDIPDQYRTGLSVQVNKARPSGGPTTIANVSLFVDDIYGRRLVFESNFDTSGATFNATLKLVDDFGNVTSLANSGSLSDNPSYSRGDVTLAVNMPYAANAGGYMDTSVTRTLTYALPFTIVHGWGDEGRGLIDKWGQRRDTMMPAVPDATCKVCYVSYKATKGDGRRELLAAEWLAQAWRAAHLNAAIGKSIFAQHYSVGFSSADTVVTQTPNGSWWITDSFDRLDVETGFSMTSVTATSADRRAATLATATATAALTGNVSGQVADLPDTSSVSAWFRSANSDALSGVSASKFYLYATTANAANAMSLSTANYETTTTDPDYAADGVAPSIGNTEVVARRQALSDAINAYVTAGFSVVATSDGMAGPQSERAGAFSPYGSGGTNYTHVPTPQRGGALVAAKYDGNGDPTEIAHTVVMPAGMVEGGGGAAQIYHQFQYDPATAADVVKGRWVNRPVGTISAASPAKVVRGTGAFPLAITGQLIWRDTEAREEIYGPGAHREPQGGWTTPFTNTLTISGSGLEGMGETDVRAATGAITAFYALQDLYRSSPSLKRDAVGELAAAWWVALLPQNVATVSVGTDVKQFVKKPNGTWLSPGPGLVSTLTQNVYPVISPRHANGYANCTSAELTYVPTRGWSYDAMSFTVRLPKGDVQTFSDWHNQMVDTSTTTCALQRGFRMTSWAWPSGPSLSFNYSRPGGYSTQIEVLSTIQNNLYLVLTATNGGFGGFTNSLMGANLRQVTASTVGSQTSHTDSIGAVTKFDIATIGTGDFAKSVLQNVYAADDGATPATQYVRDTLGRVSQTRDKFVLAGARAPTQMLLANGIRGETIDALGYSSIVYADLNGRPIRTIDKLGMVATTNYDGRGRPVSVNTPDGGQTVRQFNDRNLATQETRNANTGSAEAGTSIVRHYGWDATDSLMTSSTDGNGGETDYTYTLGVLTDALLPPAATGATRMHRSDFYYATGQPMGETGVLGQQINAAYTGAALYSLENLIGSLDGVTNFGSDAQGDAIDVVSPRSAHTTIVRDALRRPTLVAAPAVGTAPRTAQRVTYDLLGRVTKAERGTYLGTAFTPLETYTQVFDALGNRIQETTPAGVTQWSFDPLNRVQCVARRMNPQVYGNLPNDACAPSAVGPNGPDRITRLTYDPAGHVVTTEAGVGTALQQVTARYGWSAATGLRVSLTDANGNMSALEYDGFNRLKKLRYPAAPRGSGAASTTDYEQWAYDANGNVTSLRKRDGSVINYIYNALNQMTEKDLPGTTSGDIYYAYSGISVNAAFGAPPTSSTYSKTYDQAGRLVSDGTITATYDIEGNLVSLASPNGTTSYTYDVANRLSTISLLFWPETSPIPMGTINYGALDRRSSLVRPNGVTTTYGYDAAGRLSSLSHSANTPANAFAQTMTYNAIGQLAAQSQAGGPYVWTGQPSTTANFTHDQLNRDAAMAAASGYDANGNLISDGVRSFSYDSENHLTGVSGATAPVILGYDPFGRLGQVSVSGSGSATTFTYFGDNLIGESAGTSGRHYSYDGGQPFLAREFTTGASAQQDFRFFEQDRLGSVISTSDETGRVTPYTYGPYGEPQSWAGSRFRYTGQIALAEAQVYHYRARAYDPMMGRFLQTDPIRYADGPNIYAYVHGDPVNGSDPSGLDDQMGAGPKDTHVGTVDELLVTGTRLGNLLDVVPVVIPTDMQFLGQNTIRVTYVYVPPRPSFLTTILRAAWHFITHQNSHDSTDDPDHPGDSNADPTPPTLPDFDFNDPTKPPQTPDGRPWEWHGAPDSAPGDDKGGWVNPDNPDQSLHPDLDHGPGVGAHWDYTDRNDGTNGWRVLPGGFAIPK